ncbi:hypothetical protein B0T10DRAFT_466547 [Thelonectria olida]|uniref:Uncharacterized protein n=1 Tax=Thelonectria olida TaxID=1576542 RepID=A0A9P8VTG6_9HYPO|nr:hypothetical protein B0T10DRAFT_466547 [Thelonectria olida]
MPQQSNPTSTALDDSNPKNPQTSTPPTDPTIHGGNFTPIDIDDQNGSPARAPTPISHNLATQMMNEGHKEGPSGGLKDGDRGPDEFEVVEKADPDVTKDMGFKTVNDSNKPASGSESHFETKDFTPIDIDGQNGSRARASTPAPAQAPTPANHNNDPGMTNGGHEESPSDGLKDGDPKQDANEFSNRHINVATMTASDSALQQTLVESETRRRKLRAGHSHHISMWLGWHEETEVEEAICKISSLIREVDPRLLFLAIIGSSSRVGEEEETGQPQDAP